ncbi:MAG TPA: hypothetical protein VNL98_04775 [Gemmatimonadales bacterium]|nr:hypothetical protein [Gemmatimonadales bacterium]
MLVEAQVVVRGHIRDTFDEWGEADSLVGLDRIADGTLQLSGTPTDLFDQTVSDGFITDLDRVSPLVVAMVEWRQVGANVMFNNVRLRLHPDVAATGRQVDFWQCQVLRVHRVRKNGPNALTGITGTGDILELLPLSSVVTVAETGTAERDVSFTFPRPIRPRDLGRPLDGDTLWPYPVLVFQLWAIKKDGTAAGNVGWRRNSAQASYTQGNITLYGKTLTETADGFKGGRWQITGTAGGTPRMRVQYNAYANDDVSFTTNPFDLGATPASTDAVRFFGQASPNGGSVTFQVRNNADTDWITYTDGQTATQVGVSARQTYKMRALINTNAAADVTPIVFGMGVEEVTVTPLHDVAEVESIEWVIDPMTLQATIPEIRIRGFKDGVHDFNAAIEELFANNDTADISFALYYGHPSDARADWCLLDVFPIVEDLEHDGHSIVVIALNPLGYLTGGPARLPRYNSGTGKRDELVYTNPTDTPKEIWENLLNTQLAPPGRYIGQPPENPTFLYVDDTGTIQTFDMSTISLSKRIADSDVRTEVDAVSYIAGYATTAYGGRIRAVQMRGGEGPLRAIITADEISWTAVTPGFRLRRPVVFAEYGTFDNPDEPDEIRAFHQAGIDNLGQGRVQTVDRLPEAAMSYVQAKLAAEAIAAREVAAFGTGLLQWSFEHVYPRPDLTLGDRIALEVDRFVARDPNAARALRGALWVAGRIVGIHNAEHTRFSVWIENWADIIASNAVVTRTGLVELASCWLTRTADQSISHTGPGFLRNVINWTAEDHDTSEMHDTATNNEFVTIPINGRYRVRLHMEYTGLTGTIGNAGRNPQVQIQKNSLTGIVDKRLRIFEGTQPADGSVDLEIPSLVLADGDTLRVNIVASLDTGESYSFTVKGGSTESFLSVQRLGPLTPVEGTRVGGGVAVDPIRRRWPFRA